MKIEIETRFLEIDKKDLIEKLKKFGAIDMGEVKLDEIKKQAKAFHISIS